MTVTDEGAGGAPQATGGAAREAAPLPWAVALIALAVLLGPGVAGAVWGPPATSAAVAGALVGLGAAVLGDARLAGLAAAAALAGAALSALGPPGVGLVAVAPALAALAGWGSWRTGSRALGFAVVGWAMMLRPVEAGPAETALAAFALAAAWGAVVAALTGIAARAPRLRATPGEGVSLALTLWIGLALAFAAVAWLDDPRGVWVATMFAMRGLAPPGGESRAALRFGLGAVAGALAAGVVTQLPAPPWAFALGGLALAVVGLRHLTTTAPIAPACFSAAVLLAVAPGAEAAVLRIEAAVVAATLAVALAYVAAQARAALAPRAA